MKLVLLKPVKAGPVLPGRPATWLAALSKTEFDLLAQLARHLGEVVPYAALPAAVWGYPAGQGERKLVTNGVGRLRRKLGESGGRPAYLVTVRGVGYRLRNQRQWEAAVGRGR